jgi:methylglutaconyl-CoA hydratase
MMNKQTPNTTNTACVQHYIESGIGYLVLNRPEKRNAFNEQMIQTMIESLAQLEREDLLRCLILKSTGSHFSAGADLNWMKAMVDYDHAQNLEDARQLALLMEMLHRFAKPTICLVQGGAFGGALGLIACCDLVVASPEATFCLSEVRLGLAPSVISPYVTHKIGIHQAKRYCLTAESFCAETAKQIGLVHEVVPTDYLEQEGSRLASCLLKAAPFATEETKALLNVVQPGRTPFDKSITDYTTELIARLRVSQEGQEGVSAFLEKRSPAWHKTFD